MVPLGWGIEGRTAYTGVPKKWSFTTALPELILPSTPRLQDQETVFGLITYITTELLRNREEYSHWIITPDHCSQCLILITRPDFYDRLRSTSDCRAGLDKSGAPAFLSCTHCAYPLLFFAKTTVSRAGCETTSSALAIYQAILLAHMPNWSDTSCYARRSLWQAAVAEANIFGAFVVLSYSYSSIFSIHKKHQSSDEVYSVSHGCCTCLGCSCRPPYLDLDHRV